MTFSTVFVIELQSRRAEVRVLRPGRLLICDRDPKWSLAVVGLHRGEGVRMILTPVRSQNRNACGTVRALNQRRVPEPRSRNLQYVWGRQRYPPSSEGTLALLWRSRISDFRDAQAVYAALRAIGLETREARFVLRIDDDRDDLLHVEPQVHSEHVVTARHQLRTRDRQAEDFCVPIVGVQQIECLTEVCTRYTAPSH